MASIVVPGAALGGPQTALPAADGHRTTVLERDPHPRRRIRTWRGRAGIVPAFRSCG